ncbi:MAG TPA: carbon storage regulator [Candidatus Anammoximicrobium sp.]|nr:carbon storage regulator [Candidatus Anammoximicrobium sp.]
MLILSRKAGERIKLGDSIILTVMGVSGDKVRVGIQAPANVLVLRDELKPYHEQQRTLKLRAAA